MGQKVNPVGMRLGKGKIKSPISNWYTDKKNFAGLVLSDFRVREYLKKRLAQASVSYIKIDRPAKNAIVTIYSARPGVVIGKKGEDIEKIRAEIMRIVKVPVQLKIEEIRKPDLDANLVGQSIASQLERRIMFRRAMKRAVTTAMRGGALGIKVCVSGRLGGTEIARSEWYREGRVPLHTLRADIDYGFAEANTTYGIIGVKVWIFKGEIIGSGKQEEEVTETEHKG
jgi:small subunit ribosomal protein S3